jgi:hypothetical protein
LDAKTEDSEALLPLPEATWFALLEHQERQQAERAALAEVWKDHDLVFPSERGTPMEPTNLSRSFARLRETAGLPGVRLHDLRHMVVSLLMELGVPPHVVQAIGPACRREDHAQGLRPRQPRRDAPSARQVRRAAVVTPAAVCIALSALLSTAVSPATRADHVRGMRTQAVVCCRPVAARRLLTFGVGLQQCSRCLLAALLTGTP